MSTIEENVVELVETTKPEQPSRSFLDQILSFLSLVSLGIILLIILVFLSFLGMVIVQQNVQGFDVYYASLTPAEKWLFGGLGLFDVYHSWYFNLLLLLLSLNIILASIDRFPSAWQFISSPKLDASKKWLLGQKQNATIKVSEDSLEKGVERVSAAFKANGYSAVVSEKNGKKYVFGERGKWNRMGAYIVHVALLTLFLGHFVALQTGFDADIQLQPGQTTNEIQMIRINLDKTEKYSVALPFTITCTDIEQKLIDPNGTIDIQNTMDWRTQIKIDDPAYGVSTADVSLNRPHSYRGYRFFQASAITLGSARKMKLELTPQSGGGQPLNIDIERNGTATLPDGTKIEHQDFLPDFTFNAQGQPDTKSAEYNNPTAVLMVTPPQGEKTRIFAFNQKLPDSAPIGAPKLGYKWRLAEFQKSPLAHVLSIKYDPYEGHFIAWYIGGFGLMGALVFVFFVSHQRIWALLEPSEQGGQLEISLGGNTNRSQLAFEERFDKLVNAIEDKR